ncbi:unnamed protein product [Brachionus calyciflorus]|uniref:Uncharacterized protein n=1 Tax=Brachionus calyciflorus TaxID=104777 RepID=A0A813MVY0_9BILA|nr:unnamed protein product [Brachionus calyciflorus]
MYSEILQHQHFCKNFTRLFKGKDEILDKLKLYVKNDERNQPFVMHGPSGCGKSSILAKCALMIRPLLGNKCQPVIITRFLGTTPDSSSIYPLLKSICHQISHNYQKPIDNIPLELSNLTNHFKKLLECATTEKPLFIFLDSLDQLSPINSAHSLSWMPVNLPKNVKIIVSTLTGYFGMIETLNNMIEIPENFAYVEPLGEELALNITFEMLKNIQRTINDQQLAIVKESLRACNSPLYVKLVFDQISLWKSYTLETSLAKSIDDCISKLFERVENSHGKILVSHALAYITASKNGLSEAELEDLISLDETVLNDIYQYHLPPIRRIPPLLWTRIRNDIPSYLSEREADGVSVVFWYHRQFIQVSTKRFLSNQKFKAYVHSQIADYFMGVWANVPKPYSYTEEQKRMFLLKSMHGEADRKVPAQPEIFYNPIDNSVRYNGRKLSELPFHLLRSRRIEELYSKVLFHYKFLYAKLCCMPLNSLIADFEDCLSSYKYDKEVVLVSDALRLSSSVLSVSASNLVPQIVGRLLPYIFINSKKFSNVKRLIEECESDGLHDCALVPAYNCFHVPGGPLVYSLEAHPFAVYGLSLIVDGTQLLSVSNRFIIFDLSSGDVVRVINPQIEGILQSLSVSADKKYCVSFSNNDQIIVCNIISGDVKVLNRYTSNSTPAPVHDPKNQKLNNSKNKPVVKKNTIESSPIPKEYSDTLIGSSTGINYFVIWSKYFYYVYDKKARIVKADKWKFPIIQIEIVENKSIENYGVELEMITRAEDCRDDEEKDRDHLILEYKFILDQSKIPKKNKDPIDLSEEDILKLYIASCNMIEIHSCLILTRDKKKLFTCTEIGDNTVECFRNRVDRAEKSHVKNIWKYHGALDDNYDQIISLILSDDENYMLAVVIWGFKVFYLPTGQSKPLKFPPGIKNIAIGYKKLYFSALFSKDNKYVVAGVRDNIYIWDTSYGIFLKVLDAHYGRITNLLGSFKEQKNLVLSSSMDKTIKIWNLNNIMEEDFPIDHLEKPIEALHVSIMASIVLAQSRNQLAIFSLKDGKIKHQLCHNPHGALFTCSTMSSTGTFAVSSESNRLVIWDIDEKRPTFVGNSQPSTTQIKQFLFHQSEINILVSTLDNINKLVTITNYIIPDGEVIYTIEYNLKPGTEYKNFVVTSDDAYLVFFRNDKKNDMLAVHSATDGSHLHNVKLQYPNYIDFISMVPMQKNQQQIAIIDAEKGNIINVKDKKFLRSIPKWNGRATRDDKFGLYAPTRGGLEVLDLKNGSKVKILIPKIAEGVFDVDTIITENDRHVIYYHSGRRTIRAFRLEDGKKIADYKSTARVKCMICTQDSKNVIIGCEDGTIHMLIIADPEMEDHVNYLKEWRAEQMTLFAREAVSSPTPPQDESTSTIFFKGLNAFTQLFDTEGNKTDEIEEVKQEISSGEKLDTPNDQKQEEEIDPDHKLITGTNELTKNQDDDNDVIIPTSSLLNEEKESNSDVTKVDNDVNQSGNETNEENNSSANNNNNNQEEIV